MWTLAVPDNFPDLYKLPGKVLTRIRQEFSTGAYLECKAGISLFPYDNDTMVIYPYSTSAAQPSTVYLHAAGEVRELEMPVRKHPKTGEPIRIQPLYAKEGETVFELQAMPGKYELVRMIRG